ncbi:hypothetical protein BT96DRAFT_922061 [Gymnopus androsaceus JB14]|uniref:Uncharacterized protein n=1 Tax=Gymnopus androsaceus JB14 TaxID=1447944 RepID=A0A6A4HFL8_9AGAR|nr:hypothetical protein BT96DRAFT_922061 [Gymnopus androsaceus JB14]
MPKIFNFLVPRVFLGVLNCLWCTGVSNGTFFVFLAMASSHEVRLPLKSSGGLIYAITGKASSFEAYFMLKTAKDFGKSGS